MPKTPLYKLLRDGGYETGDVERVQEAIDCLKRARTLLIGAGAVKSARRVRAALSSAAGAERAAYGRLNRMARRVGHA